jgi:hypothetical protein
MYDCDNLRGPVHGTAANVWSPTSRDARETILSGNHYFVAEGKDYTM